MRLLVVTSMRNEGPFLVEWVAWLRRIGVTDLLVYSNDCDDGTDRLLDALAGADLLTHVRQSAPPQGRSVQWQALKSAWAHPLRKTADWAMVLDCDEFPVPLTADTLTDVLAGLSADALALPWRLFGNAGHIEPPDAPTTRAFDRAAPVPLTYPAASSFIKTAFRMGPVFTGFGVHRPKQKKGAVPVIAGPDGAPLDARFAATKGLINLWGVQTGAPLVQLNHYSVRSAASFLVKRDRGLPNHAEKEVGLGYWVDRNFNTVQDDAAARFQPALAREMAAVRAVAGVTRLEAEARDWHAARFATLMQDAETARLFGRLVLAAGSRAPDAARGHALVQAYVAAARSKDGDRT
jgi:hypothetical protein